MLLGFEAHDSGPREYPDGNILEILNAQDHSNTKELIELANDRERWREWRDIIEGKRDLRVFTIRFSKNASFHGSFSKLVSGEGSLF